MAFYVFDPVGPIGGLSRSICAEDGHGEVVKPQVGEKQREVFPRFRRSSDGTDDVSFMTAPSTS